MFNNVCLCTILLRLLVPVGALLPIISSSAAELDEDFASSPVSRGWRSVGETNLFQWDRTNKVMRVEWDSSRPNSYFYHPLGTILTKSDDVQLSFDMQLDEIAVGITPGKLFSFELAVGLLNLEEAAATNFLRGTGTQSPDLLEFDYFPDSGFGATISPVIVSSNNQFMAAFSFPLELTLHDQFHIELAYTTADQTLRTTMLRNGAPFGPIKTVTLDQSFTDFHVDAVALASYSDTGADGSVRAVGNIGNLHLVFPDPPAPRLHGGFVGRAWQVNFPGSTNWVYSLERSEDLATWQRVGASVAGTGAEQVVTLDQASEPASHAFYRVRLERP